MAVRVYSQGLCFCSVCAPADMAADAVVSEVNEKSPSGTDLGWQLSDEDFRTGEKNGFKAECGRHWLLEC